MTTSSDPTETAVIGSEPKSPIGVDPKSPIAALDLEGLVYIGRKDDGFFAVDPDTARDLARRLLVEADHAEGKRPAHIYQVDNR